VRRLAALLLLCAGAAHAQDIEPRAYSNAPVGVNFAIAGYVFTRGGLNFDGALPITDARLGTSNAIFAYARVLDLWGRTGKFDVIAPYTRLFGTAQFDGEPIERAVIRLQPSGVPAFGQPLRLAGAAAARVRRMEAGPDRGRQRAGLATVGPIRRQPPGQHRRQPLDDQAGAGVSKALGSWTLEMQAAATFFGDNDDFFGGHTRSQDPILSLQGHVIHSFPSGQWLSLDATWLSGGRTRIDGERGNDLQQNWRAGLIYALPLDRRHSLKFSASRGLWARTGNSFDALGVAWQYRWGGGI
jgi:hypothetical protein